MIYSRANRPWVVRGVHRVQQPFCSREREDSEVSSLRGAPAAEPTCTDSSPASDTWIPAPPRVEAHHLIPLPGRMVEEPRCCSPATHLQTTVPCTALGATIKDLSGGWFVTEKSRAFSYRKSEFYFPGQPDKDSRHAKCLGMASAHAPRASSSALPSSGPTKGGSASGPMPSRFDASFDRLTHTFGIEPTGAGDTKVSRRAS